MALHPYVYCSGSALSDKRMRIDKNTVLIERHESFFEKYEIFASNVISVFVIMKCE